MIFKRVVRDYEEKDVLRIEFAEVHDGDEFFDKNGDHHMVSISDASDTASVKSVLHGLAHDSHIEPLSKLTIMEHFRDENIVRLQDALSRRDFNHIEWRYLDERGDWKRFQDWRYHSDKSIMIFTDDGETVEYRYDQPIRLV